MREIKFRAWDGKTICYMPENIIEPYWNIQLSEFLDDHYDCDIMQFTGLKDKNGVEIYEGDIILYQGTKNFKTTCVVVQDSGGWSFDKWSDGHAKEGLSQFWFPDTDENESEVIGNIYEHKHLLEDTQA